VGEPVHIREILPEVMQDIARRMELNRQKKILSALSDYYQNRRQGRPRERRRRRMAKLCLTPQARPSLAYSGKLFERGS
jgi:hypothetical protein